MWTIGIKSGFITVLGLIAYGLIVQLMRLQHTLWSSLEYVVLALGIYSGHYYYKSANSGFMTYKQGLKLGLVIVSLASLVNTLPIYLYARFMDATFITQLIENVQSTLQKTATNQAVTEKAIQFMHHMTPEFLLIGIFISTILLGFSFTLIIAAFSRHPRKTTQA